MTKLCFFFFRNDLKFSFVRWLTSDSVSLHAGSGGGGGGGSFGLQTKQQTVVLFFFFFWIKRVTMHPNRMGHQCGKIENTPGKMLSIEPGRQSQWGKMHHTSVCSQTYSFINSIILLPVRTSRSKANSPSLQKIRAKIILCPSAKCNFCTILTSQRHLQDCVSFGRWMSDRQHPWNPPPPTWTAPSQRQYGYDNNEDGSAAFKKALSSWEHEIWLTKTYWKYFTVFHIKVDMKERKRNNSCFWFT